MPPAPKAPFKVFPEQRWPGTSAGTWRGEPCLRGLGNVAESTTYLAEEEKKQADEKKQRVRGELNGSHGGVRAADAHCLGACQTACFPELPWISDALPAPLPRRPHCPEFLLSHKAQVFDFCEGPLRAGSVAKSHLFIISTGNLAVLPAHLHGLTRGNCCCSHPGVPSKHERLPLGLCVPSR